MAWHRPDAETGLGEEKELVQRFLLRRDEADFRAIYRRHTPSLYRTARRMLRGDSVAAEEVMQVTWVRAIEGLGGFRWESSLRSWLIGITLNCAREHLRRRPLVAIAMHETDSGFEFSEPPSDAPDRVDLERAIAQLPDGYREVLILHDVEGYTHQEIGTYLGIEPGTSKSQLSRARHKLRAYLRGFEGVGHDRT